MKACSRPRTRWSALRQLLCARRERPRRRASEQRDEVAPLHVLPPSPRIPPYHIIVGNAALCITAKLIVE
jgi:hypothetical protein